jgi:hypothetical protein
LKLIDEILDLLGSGSKCSRRPLADAVQKDGGQHIARLVVELHRAGAEPWRDGIKGDIHRAVAGGNRACAGAAAAQLEIKIVRTLRD